MKSSRILKFTLRTCLLALPMLALNVHAQYTGDVVWDPSNDGIVTGTADWSDGNQWQTVPAGTFGAAPSATLVAHFETLQVPCIVDSAAVCGRLALGDNTPAGSPVNTLIITNGGSLATEVNDFTAIGYNSSAVLDVESGCSLSIDGHLWIGFLPPSVGNLTMHGGTTTVTGQLGLGFAGGTGFVHLNGGTLNLANWIPNAGNAATNGVTINNTSVLDIAGGTLIITGDHTASGDGSVPSYIAGNRITAYGGAGTFNIDFGNINVGMTTVSATPPSGGGGSSSHITYFAVSGGQVTVSYAATPAATYHIESTASLSPPAWSTVAGSTSNNVAGSSVTFTYAVPTTHQYYRVVSP